MKKIFSLVLAVIMIASLTVSAFAETQDITVSYTAAETYVVTIPANQSFSAGSLTSTGTVSATALLAAGNTLEVTMTSANGFTLLCGESSIDYTVSLGGRALANDACVLSVAAGSTSGSAELTFATTADAIAKATIAGAHEDTITFSCEVAAK